MKSLKIISIFLVMLAALSLFAGCNTKETEESATETVAETKKSTNKKPSISVIDPTKYYDTEAPENPAELPKYNGKDFTHTDIYLGQESEMHVITQTTEEEYKAYLTDLETSGYEFYTDNKLGDNLFSTYINDTHILNVMYIPAFKQTRIIVDERSTFSLPGLEEENTYEETVEPSLILLSDDEITWPGRMGYIYQLSDGSFFIIDGGWSDDNPKLSSAPLVMSVLEKYAPDPENIKISAWFISHQHTDHLGAMYDIARNEEYRSKIKVEKIIYNMPNQKDLGSQDKSSSTTGVVNTGEKMTYSITNLNPDQVIKAHPGQVFYIKDVKFTVYHSHDLLLYAPISTNEKFLLRGISTHNDTSVVTKVEFEGKTALYMADSSSMANTYVLDPVYGEALDADILQVAHHGYGDTSANNVYKHISPEIVFWPVKRGHYDGKNPDGSVYYESGSAYGGVAQGQLNSSLFKEGIKHFVFKNDICIVIDDFETWEGREWDALPNE